MKTDAARQSTVKMLFRGGPHHGQLHEVRRDPHGGGGLPYLWRVQLPMDATFIPLEPPWAADMSYGEYRLTFNDPRWGQHYRWLGQDRPHWGHRREIEEMHHRIFVHCDTCGLDGLVPIATAASEPAGSIMHAWLAAHGQPPKVTQRRGPRIRSERYPT